MKLPIALLALVSVFLVGACNPNDGTQPLRIINQTSDPNLPDIVFPEPLELEQVMFDIPRDLSQQIIKNDPACLAVQPENRTLMFWKACGEYKAIEGTNIYVGLSKEEYLKLINNLSKLKTRNGQLEFRLEQVNAQRREWRENNRRNATQAPVIR